MVGPPSGASRHAFDANNQRLAVRGVNAVKVYDLETGQPIGRELPLQALRINYTEDGSTLMVPTADGVNLWNYDTDTWADIACELM